MIVVRGYRDGHRIVEDLGPGEGRIQGHGGEALGSRYVLTSVATAQPRRIAIPRQSQAEARAVRCDRLTRWGDPCSRLPGHRDPCASRAAMDRENANRRKA